MHAQNPHKHLLFVHIDGFEFFLFFYSNLKLSAPISRGDDCHYPRAHYDLYIHE